jgi:hypothetical protein
MSNPELFEGQGYKTPKPLDPHLDEPDFAEVVDTGAGRRRHLRLIQKQKAEETIQSSQPEWKPTDAEIAAGLGTGGASAARAQLDEARSRIEAETPDKTDIPTPNEGDFDENGDLIPDWKQKRAQ